jgi:iron-sulfur cluster repair protein YtfE (RIC family)
MKGSVMAEHETMNTVIHAAFRRDLARFDRALDTFPAQSQPRADQLAAAWDNFSFQLHHHHSDEETIFFPALRSLGADEPLAQSLEAEHAAMLTDLDAASASMRQLKADPSASNAAEARSAISRLGATMSDHLTHEERDLEPLAVAHKKSAQMKASQRAVRRAHKGNQGAFCAWLLDGADPDAVRGLRREIPPPVLFVLSRVGGRQYTRDVASVWA